MSEAEKLRDTLRSIQEPRGYYFNKDEARTLELLQALLTNKARYGYMVCQTGSCWARTIPTRIRKSACDFSKGCPYHKRKRIRSMVSTPARSVSRFEIYL